LQALRVRHQLSTVSACRRVKVPSGQRFRKRPLANASSTSPHSCWSIPERRAASTIDRRVPCTSRNMPRMRWRASAMGIITEIAVVSVQSRSRGLGRTSTNRFPSGRVNERAGPDLSLRRARAASRADARRHVDETREEASALGVPHGRPRRVDGARLPNGPGSAEREPFCACRVRTPHLDSIR
jgi:hypothetical protein